MIKRNKKKCKSNRPDLDNFIIADHSRTENLSQNNQETAFQGNFNQERQARIKKMRSPKSRSKLMCPRSKSLPPKTVSFCPYVLNRFTRPPTKAKNDVCRSNSCNGCRPRTGTRKSGSCRKKMAAERGSQGVNGPDSYMSSENACLACKHQYRTGESPAPSKCGIGNMWSSEDYNPSCWPESSQTFPSYVHGEGHAPSYHNYGAAPSYHNANSSSAGPACISDLGHTRSPWLSVKRSLLHCSPGVKNWGAAAKHDYLMAKYSEHNCPRSHPALADYFSFQKQSVDVNQLSAHSSRSKSPSSWLACANVTHNRSNSQTRADIAPKSCSWRSLFGGLDKYCTSQPFSNSISNTGRALSSTDAYQSEAMRDLMYKTVSTRYINESCSNTGSRAASAKSDSELNARFQRGRSPANIFTSIHTPAYFSNRHGVDRWGKTDHDFADDMKFMGRSFNTSTTSSFPFTSGPQTKPCYTQRSRSSDASLALGSSHYNDVDKILLGRHDLTSVGQSASNNKSASSNYDHWSRRGSWKGTKLDNWKSTDAKFDNWKSTDAKFDKWKSTDAKLDNWKSADAKLDNWKSTDAKFDNWKSADAKLDSWKSSDAKLDNWKSTDAKLDNWKSTDAKFDNWTSTILDKVKPTSKFLNTCNFPKSVCANNSNEKGPGLRPASNAALATNNNWRSKNIGPDIMAFPKAADTSSYLHKLDCSDSNGHYDKFTNWCAANSPNSEQAAKKLMEETKDINAKSNFKPDSANRISSDFTALCAMKRESSVSPVRRRKLPGLHLKPYLQGTNAPYNHSERPSSHFQSNITVAMDRKTEPLSTGTDCKLFKYHNSDPYSSCNSFIRNTGTHNMNVSQNNGPVSRFQTVGDLCSRYLSQKYSPATDPSFLDQHDTSGNNPAVAKSPDEKMYAGLYCDNSTQMLNSLVEQEADRLRKIASVIERQQDSEQ